MSARTGKSWTQWFAILDAADALGMPHPDIAQLLYDRYGVDGWWAQMLTVGYEQARGRRRKNQKADGFAVNVSRTVHVPVAALYRAWSDVRRRVAWLGERGIQVRKATAEKSMRITWSDGTTSVDVNFYARGPKKSQVTCQHTRLARESDVERMRTFWKQALDTLKSKLEM